MQVQCTHLDRLKSSGAIELDSKVIRVGWFRVRYRSKPIRRYRCNSCGQTFSRATVNPRYRQKKRQLNAKIEQMLCSSTSQRRIAKNLGISRVTVARKLRFLAEQAKLSVEAYLKDIQRTNQPIKRIYLDELETHEHTNAKPLSVSLIVTQERKILGFEIATFLPKTTRLRNFSIKKYGQRPETRRKALHRLVLKSKPLLSPDVDIFSDECPFYPNVVKAHLPFANHKRYKSKRAAVAGLGELKENGHDPLFPINHTFAMLRDNIKRLTRRTWCTTKKIKALEDHLYLYMNYHNTVLTQ